MTSRRAVYDSGTGKALTAELSGNYGPREIMDRVRWNDLVEGAQIRAVFGYNVAQLPEMLPRKPAKSGGS